MDGFSLAATFSGGRCLQESRIYRIERDEELIANLIDLKRRFLEFVITDTVDLGEDQELSQLLSSLALTSR